MSTIIQIKRNSGTTAPTTSDLVIGEMAYAYDASNDGASAKLYIEATNNASAADIHLIGGKYFTDLMDHTLGTTTASSALLVDSSSKLDAINIDNSYACKYETLSQSTKHVQEIKKALKSVDRILLATDPDREGEAISWHLHEILKNGKCLKDKEVKRIVFHILLLMLFE